MSERHFEFVTASGLVEPDLIALRRVRGREELAQPYEYELDLEVNEDGGLDEDALHDLLRQPCMVRFGSEEPTEVHGVLSTISMQSTRQPQPIWYRATLVPRLWLLSQVRRSRVFQDLDAPGIARAVLHDLGLNENEGFEVRLTQSYPVSEYTVQYQETDLDFLQRILEHHGIYYFFEQQPDGERIILADDNATLVALPGWETIDYTPGDGADLAGVRELRRDLLPQPRAVLLRDYNWRTPSVPLQCEAAGDELTGRGLLNLYGDHFKSPSDGAQLARIRAQERLAARDVYHGRCRVAALRPGHRVKLSGHPCADLDREYLVTAIEHEAGGGGMQDAGGVDHDLEFRAIPYAIAFRPERRTARPRIAGVMHARVDGEVPGTAAPIDEYGRYKVLFPFDLAGQSGGKASRWVRLAQPSSGPGFGIHFPLHIGAEVAVAHLDGDPDRPIIVNSPPNAETLTPVSQANATQSQIITQTGIRLTWDDDC